MYWDVNLEKIPDSETIINIALRPNACKLSKDMKMTLLNVETFQSYILRTVMVISIFHSLAHFFFHFWILFNCLSPFLNWILDLLVKSINDLIMVIRQLKAEVLRQRNDIQNLRSTLDNCVGCKEPAQQRISCASGPCYPGE